LSIVLHGDLVDFGVKLRYDYPPTIIVLSEK